MNILSVTQCFLEAFFESIETQGIPYCVLHGYQTLPEMTISDIDIVIEPQARDLLDKIIYQIATKKDFLVTQKLYYDIPYCYYYVLCRIDDGKAEVIQLDFLIDPIGVNRYVFTSKELLSNRKRFRNFYIPETSTEAVYLLWKKLVKGKFYPEHQRRLSELYTENSTAVGARLQKCFGMNDGELVIRVITGEAMLDDEAIARLRKSFQARNISVINRFLKFYWLARRGLYRILFPTGLFIAFLSPDGGGKSTVAKGVLQLLNRNFRRTRYLYWRPGVLPELGDLVRLKFRAMEGRANPDPHGRKKDGLITSYVRFFYYTLDFILGGLKLRFLKTITTLVALDRYYYDFMVDKKRYGFRVPEWLIRMVEPIVPKPDLVFYLDSDPELMVQRKQELTLAEVQRQVKMFRTIAARLPNTYTINTARPVEEVIADVAGIITARKAEALSRRMAI